MLVPNLFGSVLSLYYLHVFETHTTKGVRTTELSTCYRAGIVLLGLILLQVVFGDQTKSAELVGTCGAVLSVVFTVSPLMALPAVIKARSPESIPLSTAVILFLNAALWILYGFYVVDDRSIWFPNVVGLVASGAQIAVHAIFAFDLIPVKHATMSGDGGIKVASL